MDGCASSRCSQIPPPTWSTVSSMSADPAISGVRTATYARSMRMGRSRMSGLMTTSAPSIDSRRMVALIPFWVAATVNSRKNRYSSLKAFSKVPLLSQLPCAREAGARLLSHTAACRARRGPAPPG